MKKAMFKAQFNNLNINQEDPTILRGKVIIHDFLPSWNNQAISEEICKENMNTLIGKRIVCNYIPSKNNNGIDSLTGHEEEESEDRNGNKTLITNTIAIGFIENVYIDDYVDETNNSKRVLFADVVVWNDDKYTDIVGLLQEWISRGIKIHMSVEYLYCNYNMIDGIEWLQSPIIYIAHTFLNSEQRGEYAEILPSYDCSTLISFNEKQKWNKTINELSKSSKNQISNKSKNNKEENNMENKFLKALNELSFGDIRNKIYTELSKVMTAQEYEYMYISNYNIFDTYFVYETYENDEWVNYKINYTKNSDDTVTIDFTSKAKAEFSVEWVSSTNAKKAIEDKTTELTSANTTINDLKIQLNKKDETIKTLNSKIDTTSKEKNVTIEKFNDLTNTVTSLNAQVKVLKPIADKYNEDQYEKSLNSAKDFYKKKFESIDAIDIFEKEDTQELIKKTINSNIEESQKAKFSLNDLIINNLKPVENNPQLSLNSVQQTKEQKDLLNNNDDEFEKIYGIKRD